MHTARCVSRPLCPWCAPHAQLNLGSKHRLQIGSSQVTMDLNDLNHSVQRFDTAAAYVAARRTYLSNLIEKLSFVEDAITGNRLRIDDQLVYIGINADDGKTEGGVKRSGKWADISNIADLAELMTSPSSSRTHGTHAAQGVLVRAGPGTGKTVSLSQLTRIMAVKLLRESPEPPATTAPGPSATVAPADGDVAMNPVQLVPLLLNVQRLASYMKKSMQSLAGTADLLREYIALEYDGDEKSLLLQAYEMKALVLAIDGVDEAAGLKSRVEDLVLLSLAPSGVRLCVSSRPEGVRLERYAAFVVLNLSPLSETQQRQAIAFQLKDSKEFDHLTSLSKLFRAARDAGRSDADAAAAVAADGGAHYEQAAGWMRAAHGLQDETEVRASMEAMLAFYEAATTVPVLLSMLVLILAELGAEIAAGVPPTTVLPSCRLDLYKAAVRVSIARRAVAATEPTATKDQISRILAALAVANHLAQRREFTSHDVRAALTEAEMATWKALEKEELGLPLTKTLEIGANDDDATAKVDDLSSINSSTSPSKRRSSRRLCYKRSVASRPPLCSPSPTPLQTRRRRCGSAGRTACSTTAGCSTPSSSAAARSARPQAPSWISRVGRSRRLAARSPNSRSRSSR